MMHHWDQGWGAGNWLLMGFGMVVFWALLVAVIVWLVRSCGTRPSAVSSAREILDERYARGEITDEEYRARRNGLLGR